MDNTSQSLHAFRHPLILEQILRGFALFRGMSHDEMERLVERGSVLALPRGTTLFDGAQPSESLSVIVRGRAEISGHAPGGAGRPLGQIGPGGHFGEIGLLTGTRLAVRVVARTDVLLLAIDRAHFEELLSNQPSFAASLSRALGSRLADPRGGKPSRPLPAVVGFSGPSPRVSDLIAALARALGERKASVHCLRPEAGKDRFAILQTVAELRAKSSLVLLDLGGAPGGIADEAWLSACEELWWVLDPASASPGLQGAEALFTRRKHLHGRTRLVWALREAERPVPGTRPSGLIEPELRVFLPESARALSRRERLSLARLASRLLGTRLALALGGGGARGMAHIGVLKALDDAGIAVERIAGTSIGALVGMQYAAGVDPLEILRRFDTEVAAGPLLRRLPGGTNASLLWKARFGGFRRPLRKHYGALTFQELDLPLQTVTADLLAGECVARDTGDCVEAVLESINLPLLTRPIQREGRVLVDGGVLNNVPSDLLVSEEVDAVLAIDVMALDPTLAEPRPRRVPGLLETLLRITELQRERLADLGGGPADLVLRVPTGVHSIADFSPATARRIVEAGSLAVQAALPQIRALVAPPTRD